MASPTPVSGLRVYAGGTVTSVRLTAGTDGTKTLTWLVIDKLGNYTYVKPNAAYAFTLNPKKYGEKFTVQFRAPDPETHRGPSHAHRCGREVHSGCVVQ